jgi:small subunit ribosomal protein S20|uniref:ribosomal protein S20 n=1 Tax=Cryptomonas gyropyrenoidosa TaxID=233257 RepID=UPI0027A86408|nr:ribosomal protein S20 [Cryptomonas gyropyrenoidosa]WFQ82973.1 ribosomal protein S20 [Cryptomonas gyropyrenoidosa]
MANTKSAYKRIGITERNRLRNKAYRSTIKTVMKKTLIGIKELTNENASSVQNLISLSYSKIDKAIQKGIIHRNNGKSKKASLIKAFKSQTARTQV